MPKISVIVPIYNTEQYLERCLRSLMTQTFRNFEILCVDDVSPDNSVDIIERLAAEDARIRLIRHEKNLGLGGARNTGLEQAKSEWIASVDSDDYVASDFLEILWNGTEGGHFDVVVCGYEEINEDGVPRSRHMASKKKLDPLPEGSNPFKITNPSFWNKLWRRSLYADNDIWFPHHLYYQDRATTPRIYSTMKNINFVGGVPYKYLIREGSVTQSVSDKHLFDQIRVQDVLKDFFVQQGTYEGFSSEFRERVFRGFSYHTENIVRSHRAGTKESNEYLRHLLLLREAYLALDDRFRAMTFDEKKSALLKHETLLRYEPEQSVTPAIESATPFREPLPENPRVLVLTLHSGENEFSRSKASLGAQVHTNWEHLVIEGLESAEAHSKLYETIMERAREFDLFVKLDADTLFGNTFALEDVLSKFRSDRALDHLVVPCRDFMTGEDIIGVHAFSPRVSWPLGDEDLFVDPNPDFPGRSKVMDAPKRAWFYHSPDPSLLQAFHFGAHRCLKITQPNRAVSEKRTYGIREQWRVLLRVRRQYDKRKDRRHALALIGADLVQRGLIDLEAANYHSHSLKSAFETWAARTSTELDTRIQEMWTDEQAALAWYREAAGTEGLVAMGEYGARNQIEANSTSKIAKAGLQQAELPPGPVFREVYEEAVGKLREAHYQAASELFQVAAQIRSWSKLAKVGMAEAYVGLGEKASALEIYKALVRVWPEDPKLDRRYQELSSSTTLPTVKLPPRSIQSKPRATREAAK
ncbi:glycosyltransferase [Nesterenkonia populi]|uniref:glycosyltransferase n=1 Tax=Nesterenkonia populi TaxID=1591087 RepID=UPI001FEA14E8|nr:glycosyltransferase [Nesterenkonia populi]